MTSPEPEFTALKKLLALKRHEQPPPGYFDRLPGRILKRIEQEDERTTSRWFEWFAERWNLRPAVGGVLGIALVGLYFVGLGYAPRPTALPIATQPERAGEVWRLLSPTPLAPAYQRAGVYAAAPGTLQVASSNPPSMTPVLAPIDGQPRSPWTRLDHSRMIQRAGYQPTE